MYLSIIILPLLGSLVSGLLGRKVGITGSQIITCTCLILSSLLISVAFYEVGLCGSVVSIDVLTWVNIEQLNVSWCFYFDQLTVSLGLAVIYCSTLIHIYSIDYLSSDPHIQRFFSYLSAFTGGMLVLICGGNFFVMFVGWEAIGVVSYLLINFYFTRLQSNKAAMLAFTMNRGGDMLMSIGFFAIFQTFGSLNYSEVFSLVPFINETAISLIALFLLGGALAKSANIPLHSWLPGSMEAPTPVSALLHAATLVTAGIYLLIRVSPILEYSSTVLLIITIIGSSTAFFAATCGLLQNDLKRIIAFSTISQLGYMMMAIGLSQYNVALMHTVNHAFFKALLFLGAGAVIHSFQDQQDVRKMGGLIKFLPFTYSVMLVGSLSLLATPFLTGFYSKDLILELAFAQYKFNGLFAFILGSITAGITAFYSFRLISLVFFSYPNGPKFSYLNSHESNLLVVIPLLILAIFSIFFGYIFSDLFTGIGSDFFANAIFIHPNNISLVEAEFSLNPFIKLLPAILSLIGAVAAIIIYQFQTAGVFNFMPSLNVLSNNIKTEALLNQNTHTAPSNGSLEGANNSLTHNAAPLLSTPTPNAEQGELLFSSAKIKVFEGKPEVCLKTTEGSTKGDTPSFMKVNLDKSPLRGTGISSPALAGGKLWAGNLAVETPLYIKIYAFLNGKYYFDVLYNQFIVVSGFKLAYTISKEIDRGVIEVFGPYGLSNLMLNTGNKLSKLDTGVITTYALYITLSLIALLILVTAPLYLQENSYFATSGEIKFFILYLASALIISFKPKL